MAPEPSFESMCFNPFLANDFLNDSTQNPDVNFYDDISSLETSYLSTSEIDENFQNSSKESFSVLHLNIRSMNKNFELFQNFYKSLSTKFSIICPTETWANDSNINHNTLFQLDRYIPVHQITKSRKMTCFLLGVSSLLLHVDLVTTSLRAGFQVYFSKPWVLCT